jgi:hypothetical protein
MTPHQWFRRVFWCLVYLAGMMSPKRFSAQGLVNYADAGLTAYDELKNEQ